MASEDSKHTGPCDLKAKRYCLGMDANLQHNTRSKGLVAIETFNISMGGFGGTLILYKKTPRDKGIILNVCPWCEASLISQMPSNRTSRRTTKMPTDDNPLRAVVESPWFEWRRDMIYDHPQDGYMSVRKPSSPRLNDFPLYDHDANVGPLLSMLRAAVDRIYTDGEIGSLDLTCNQAGTVWGVAPYDTLGEPVLEGVGPSPCIAIARAILALPETK